MNRANLTAGVVMIAFLVYVTARGQLSQYLQVIGLIPQQAQPATTMPSTSTGKGGLYTGPL